MNKTQRFMVEIVMKDSTSYHDNEVNEMGQNIADAIIDKCRNGEVCIVPEDSETYVDIVYVKGWYSDKQIIEHP